jgi:hypothetical protein
VYYLLYYPATTGITNYLLIPSENGDKAVAVVENYSSAAIIEYCNGSPRLTSGVLTIVCVIINGSG